MKCFYHSGDLDGHCSGAIVKYRYPECELVGINYGDEFPWANVEQGEIVFVVDFSLQPWKDMQRLSDWADMVWIDHHKSAIENYLEYGLKAEVGTADGVAACELTWAWVFPSKDIPKSVWALGRYDVWDHSHPDVLPFQYGMRLEDTDPGNQKLWKDTFSDMFYEAILNRGYTVLRYIEQYYRKLAAACAFELRLDGLRCIAANANLVNSQLFDSVYDPKCHDAMLVFGRKKDHWTVSMYSTKDDVDVSQICKARGGGGHKGAAGFQCQELPFDLIMAANGE